MKQPEILKLLKDGHPIKQQENYNLKYGKLERGTNYSYSINGITITSRQFDAIRSELRQSPYKPLQDREFYLIKT